ncbi:MAG: ATP-binding protein [Pseudomonadota bacterium]
MSSPELPRYIQRAIETLGDRLVVIGADLTILAVHPPSLLERRPDLVGRTCHGAFFERDSACPECGVLEVLASGRPAVREIPPFGPPWTEKTVRHMFPLYQADEKTIEAVAVMDLPANRFIGPDRGLSSANAFLKNLIMSSVDGIIASDMKGRILVFNEAAAELYGYTREEALGGLNIADVYPGDGARQVMAMLRSEKHGGPGKLKGQRVPARKKDGSIFPIDLSATIVYECGRETATVGFFYDLSEKLRLEKELQMAQVQLMQAEKMSSVGKLAAGVAHQLNNPLGSIILFGQLMLEDYDLEPAARQDLQRILGDAERCQNIVRELLDFSRQSNLEIKRNDLNRALDRTIFLLESQPLFRNIEIARNYDPDLPLVPSDLHQLGHVFMNIILNAADALGGRGRIEIKTRPSPGGRRVMVEISDNGPGIPAEVLPHVFDPFYTTKEPGQGTGLGLSVAHGVVENHGGRITARGAPGEGAAFVIELPLDRGPKGEDQDDFLAQDLACPDS